MDIAIWRLIKTFVENGTSASIGCFVVVMVALSILWIIIKIIKVDGPLLETVILI